MADIALHGERLSVPTVGSERQDRREFRLIFALAFVFFLIDAAISLLLPRSWRRRPTRRLSLRSIVAEARETADMSFPLSLMR